MTPCASVLLLLLLGLSQAFPDIGANDEVSDEDDTVDLTTTILTSNNASKEELIEGDLVRPKTRNAISCWGRTCMWGKGSDGNVKVPYVISNDLRSQQRIITSAMKVIESKTCIRFTPRRSERDFISIESRDGCYSSLGKTKGKQVLSLNFQSCVHSGIVQHELLHALGFKHEQTRSDRDQYVRINWQNIIPEMAFNFNKYPTNNLNTPYDYGSIMHYGRTAFSTGRGRATIVPIPDPNVQIGQRKGMSHWDITRIKLLYSC